MAGLAVDSLIEFLLVKVEVAKALRLDTFVRHLMWELCDVVIVNVYVLLKQAFLIC